MENSRPFIFFLTLDERLPESFYVFDGLFREFEHILVPVRVDQLQQLVSRSEQDHVLVISCVSSVRDYKRFNEKVRSVLKYLLKSRRLSFFELSSFSRLNDSRTLGNLKNYFFLKNPVDARLLVERLVAYNEMKSSQSNLWPGKPKPLPAGVA